MSNATTPQFDQAIADAALDLKMREALYGLADEWESSADRTMERALVGDPAAAMAAAHALRSCAAALRALAGQGDRDAAKTLAIG